MIKKLTLPLFLIAFGNVLFAQVYTRTNSIPVIENNYQLVNPWTGGEDAPIPQAIDMNNDGIKDLFMFEKSSTSGLHRMSTFINNGTANTVDYHYAPEYLSKFPPGLHDWVLLVDFNCDGKEDIFTYSYIGGMAIYINTTNAVSGLKFSLYLNIVNSLYWGFPSNLFVSAVNQPALVDVDNDSDLDVLTFALSANNIEYHRNYAMENLSRCDTMVMVLEKACWGKVCLSPFRNVAILNCPLASCPNGPNRVAGLGEAYVNAWKKFISEKSYHNLHSGSCMIAPDIDGDGDKDPINGDILGDSLLLLINGWNQDSAFIVAQDTAYPQYDHTVTFKTFPGPYMFDADNDGNKDLVVAPCIPNASRNHKNILFYKNNPQSGNVILSYQGDSLLVNDMIDVGSGANVTMVDIDNDGLLDLLVGNYKYVYQNQSDDARLAYYRNTGTATQPAYTLITKDLANLSTSGLFGISPTFGDLDNDGDKDMIVGADNGYLHYFQNNGGANFVLTLVQIQNSTGSPINNGSYATPQLVDLNNDLKLDLVIGERNGNLNYYENTGTVSSFSFTFVTANLGNVNTTKQGMDLYGNSQPFFYDSAGTFILYSGSLSGYIYKYNNINGNLAGTFNLVDSMYLFEPFRSTITGGDVNGDGVLDLFIGNYAGGINCYMDQTTAIPEINAYESQFLLYPNPSETSLTVSFYYTGKPVERTIIISDALGKSIFESKNNFIKQTINVSHLSNGIYFVRVISNGTVATQKFVVKH